MNTNAGPWKWYDGLVGSPCRSLTEVLAVIPAGEGGEGGEGGPGAGSDLSMMSLILMSQVTLSLNHILSPRE